MRYDWVTFDCYGTLIDWESGMRLVFARLLKESSRDGDPAALTAKYVQYEMLVQRRDYAPYKEVLGQASAVLFREELGVELSADQAGLLAESLPGWKAFEDAGKALERLKSRYKLAILSNIDDELLKSSLKTLGVHFDATITAEQVRSYKPIKNHWIEALRRFGVPEDRVFHVGASYLHDIVPAKQMGIPCAWINRKGEKVMGTVKPDLSLSDLSALPEILGA